MEGVKNRHFTVSSVEVFSCEFAEKQEHFGKFQKKRADYVSTGVAMADSCAIIPFGITSHPETLMSDLTMNQIMTMTDVELLMDLVNSGDISSCKECHVPLQESITGCRTITDDQGNKQPHCSDCYFSYSPFQKNCNIGIDLFCPLMI